MTATATRSARSFGELTRLVLGSSLTIDEVFELLATETIGTESGCGSTEATASPLHERLWVGSIGYERYRTDFAARLRDVGVECLFDVRQLPISRRRGYAKSALGQALGTEGIEYLHMRDLGNPKSTRDLYKSGRTEEGRAGYEKYLLGEQRGALSVLVERLAEKRCALMCVEHDSAICHRSVIFDALRGELGLALEVAEIGCDTRVARKPRSLRQSWRQRRLSTSQNEASFHPLGPLPAATARISRAGCGGTARRPHGPFRL